MSDLVTTSSTGALANQNLMLPTGAVVAAEDGSLGLIDTEAEAVAIDLTANTSGDSTTTYGIDFMARLRATLAQILARRIGQRSTTAALDGDLQLIDTAAERIAFNAVANTSGNATTAYSLLYLLRLKVQLLIDKSAATFWRVGVAETTTIPGIVTATTSAGAYVALPSAACTRVSITNISDTPINIQYGAATSTFATILSGQAVELSCTNANQLQVRSTTTTSKDVSVIAITNG